MSTSPDRRSQEILRRMEVRLAALEAGIARHEARAAELRQIKDRVQREREELLAKLAVSASLPSGGPAVAEPRTTEKQGTDRSERPAAKAGPPPEAEAVPETEGFTPEELWARFRTQRDGRRPVVVYPCSAALEPPEAVPAAETVPGTEEGAPA